MTFSALRSVVLAAMAVLAGAGAAEAWCVRGVDGWDTLRIRTGPSPQARQIGAIPANVCGVAITGGCRGYWCPVAWRGRGGWSNAYFLSPSGPQDVVVPVQRGPWIAQTTGPRRPAVVSRPSTQRGLVGSQRPRPAIAHAPRETAQAAAAPVVTAAVPAPPAPAAEMPPATERSGVPAPTPPTAAVPVPATAGTAVVVPAPASDPIPSTTDLCVVDVAKGDTLKVRGGPGLNQPLRFGFPAEVCGVRITGACKDGWCPVEYRGYRGWAERRFLK